MTLRDACVRDICAAADVLCEPRAVSELPISNTPGGPVSGCVDDLDKLAATAALKQIDRESAVWVAYAASALDAKQLMEALLEAHPNDPAVRGAAKLGARNG